MKHKVPKKRQNGDKHRAPEGKLERLIAFTEEARKRSATPHEIIALEERAARNLVELAEQTLRYCSDKKAMNCQKRVACGQLVDLAMLATSKVFFLAGKFPEPFREIAEELPYFPCLFPAHPDEVRPLQDKILNYFNLGRRHPLRLRAAARRKTFSRKTWLNELLFDLIHCVALAHVEGREHELDGVSLTPENAKQWLDAVWKLLLVRIPNPEQHPRLRQLGGRPSLRRKRMRRDGTVGEKTLAHNIRADIKAKLGVYLKRMLNDSAVHK